MWQYFCWGLLVGFLIEWLCDWIFWRKARPIEQVQGSSASAASVYSGMSGLASGALSGATGAATSSVGLASAALPLAAASALPAGIASYREDDIEQIEGIGPKIAELFRAAGLTTFAHIAACPMDKIVAILEAGGPRFKLANPGTWAEQAALAAKGDWAGFDKLKKELVAGVRSSDA